MKNNKREYRKFLKWGLFYYNPENPDLWVERQRPYGWGSDLNFAHRSAYYILAFMIIFPLAVTLIPLLFLGKL